MRMLGRTVGIANDGAWICQKCLQTRTAPTPLFRWKTLRSPTLRNKDTIAKYSTRELLSTRHGFFGDPPLKLKKKRRWRFIVLTGLIGLASIFALTDTARHGYAATLRTFRVAYALVESVRESVILIYLLLSICLLANLRSTAISQRSRSKMIVVTNGLQFSKLATRDVQSVPSKS